MIRRLLATFVAASVILVGLPVLLGAALPPVAMDRNDTIRITCPSRIRVLDRTDTVMDLQCKGTGATATPRPSATATPRPSATATPTQPTPTPAPGGAAVLVGAGDIANCNVTTDTATAALVNGIAGTVFTAGDNAYPDGTTSDFANCYTPTWGQFKARTRPAPGNHDYHTSGAPAYFAYFGANAGPAGDGYYAYDLGEWRVYSLNSNVISTEQVNWLKADLAANPTSCIAAYWHHPRYSSEYPDNRRGDDTSVEPFWAALEAAGAELVFNGHMHHYERMSPIRGMTEVIVGTGGTSLVGFGDVRSTSVARNATVHGVVKVTLSSNGFNGQFVPIAGKSYADSFSGSCSTTTASAPRAAAGPGTGVATLPDTRGIH